MSPKIRNRLQLLYKEYQGCVLSSVKDMYGLHKVASETGGEAVDKFETVKRPLDVEAIKISERVMFSSSMRSFSVDWSSKNDSFEYSTLDSKNLGMLMQNEKRETGTRYFKTRFRIRCWSFMA